jgi:hypothetical protein
VVESKQPDFKICLTEQVKAESFQKALLSFTHSTEKINTDFFLNIYGKEIFLTYHQVASYRVSNSLGCQSNLPRQIQNQLERERDQCVQYKEIPTKVDTIS